MSNKIKDLFNEDQDYISFTISSDQKEDIEQLIDAIKQLPKDGEPKEIDLNASVVGEIVHLGDRYQIEKHDNVKQISVSLPTAPVNIPVTIDGHKDHYRMVKKEIENGVIIESLDNQIISLRFTFDFVSNNVQLKYEPHLERADSLDSIVQEYKRIEALMNEIFRKDQINPEKERINTLLKNTATHIRHLLLLANYLGVDIKPESLAKEANEGYWIEELFILLVKNEIIRKDDKINYIDQAMISEEEIGKQILITYLQTMTVDFFGHEIELNVVNCVFNSVISDIEKDHDDNNRVLFSDTDSQPMYRAFSAFLEKEKADKELENLLSHLDVYKNACSFEHRLETLFKN